MPVAKAAKPPTNYRNGVAPIMVRPRSPEQRTKLEAAARNANVSLSYYLLESALMQADAELAAGIKIEGWVPRGARARVKR